MKVKLEGVVNVGNDTVTKEEFESELNNWLKSKGWTYQSLEDINSPYLKYLQGNYVFDSCSLMGGAIFDSGQDKRYFLSKIWDPNLPVAAAFLMNPSYANELRGDATIDFLMGYLRNRSYGGIIVINTSSIVKPSNVTKADFPKTDKENIEVILNVLGRVKTVILGWGGSGNKYAVPHFSANLKDKLELNIEKIYAFEIGGKETKTGRQLYPCHPSPTGNKNKYINKSLKKIDIKQLRKILN
ncbi:DUF1643 domain-containing protein [Aquibacillus sediminis]|uniref:DUF1643 domain-containing protein n=1 Tax=Aquibacillus sediminis TaxID=2574734 RepID=UPI001108FC90|nr:DUF1643 domain-containing protein [Aquibacillus sediminis]